MIFYRIYIYWALTMCQGLSILVYQLAKQYLCHLDTFILVRKGQTYNEQIKYTVFKLNINVKEKRRLNG